MKVRIQSCRDPEEDQEAEDLEEAREAVALAEAPEEALAADHAAADLAADLDREALAVPIGALEAVGVAVPITTEAEVAWAVFWEC